MLPRTVPVVDTHSAPNLNLLYRQDNDFGAVQTTPSMPVNDRVPSPHAYHSSQINEPPLPSKGGGCPNVYLTVDLGEETDVEPTSCWSPHSSSDPLNIPSLLSNIPNPQEKKRALIAFLMLFMAALSNDFVLAFIHERVPNTPPLPDLFFSHTPYLPFALTLSETAMLLNAVMAITVAIMNRHRFTILKRLLLISAFLYGFRALCMLVTQVPVADTKYYCSPKMNETSFSVIFSRAVSLVSGLGLSIGGKHVLCGDYIYSGHTVVLVHSYLTVREYTPKRWWLLHWVSWLEAVFGVTCLLLSRGHYSIDVVIAYWVTTTLFNTYHTMLAHPALREYSQTNLLSRFCWFPIFRWMEEGVPCNLALRFEWPLPWPRAFVRGGSKTNIY